MPRSDAELPRPWFDQGELDLEAAEILISVDDSPLPVVAFHLQQAIEKYLKGYLIATGWTLQRIHDLEVLIREAIDRDHDFAEFLEPCQRITEYYIETRYPTGLFTLFERTVLEEDLRLTHALRSVIEVKMGLDS